MYFHVNSFVHFPYPIFFHIHIYLSTTIVISSLPFTLPLSAHSPSQPRKAHLIIHDSRRPLTLIGKQTGECDFTTNFSCSLSGKLLLVFLSLPSICLIHIGLHPTDDGHVLFSEINEDRILETRYSIFNVTRTLIFTVRCV